MTDVGDRRREIIDIATRLFMKHSYGTTSMQQIADAVGCTKAALYYHFKGGKREILQAVIADSMGYITSLQAVPEAGSLEAFVRQLMTQALTSGRKSAERLSWISSSFHQFRADEKQLFHELEGAFQQELAGRLGAYVADAAEAERLAWLLVVTTAGYAQVFWNLEMDSVVDYDPQVFIEHVAALVARRG